MLSTWENKIKQKRAQTRFKDAVKEIASWMPIVLYKSKQGYLSRYPDTPRMTNRVSPEEYYKEVDDYINRGLVYDFDRDFFTNYSLLLDRVPVLARVTTISTTNAEFTESTVNVKNVYLSYIIINGCENVFYTFYAQDNSKDIFNSVMVWDNSQIVYFGVAVIKSYKVFYSRYIVNSNNVWFSTNLIGCSECIFCDGLENASYCIDNTTYPKEEYFKKKEAILLDKHLFAEYFLKLNRTAKNLASKNVQGEFCVYSENIVEGYFTYRLQNGKNVFFVGDKEGRKNVIDTFCSDDEGFGDIYAGLNLGGANNVYCVDCCVGQSLYYCFMCINCSFCIGCTGLFNKQYCILNKQYTKPEWEALAEQIFAQMDTQGILGDFFPASMNPFYFNDTLAYLIADFEKAEIEGDGFLWREQEIKVDIPTGASVISVDELGVYEGYDEKGNWKINGDILKKVIKDKQGNVYKIIKEEVVFLEQYGLPLPRTHWLERIKDNLRFKT